MPVPAWVALAFAAGTIPSPYLLALAAGRRDIIAKMRRQDSPADAHFLVTKQMSRSAGVTSIVLDIAKGFVPALLAARAGLTPMGLAFVGLAGVSGHSFAPFLRATGGRGLTTAAGVSLALIPRAMVGTGVIALAGTLTKRGGQGTGVGFALLPVFAALFSYAGPLVGMAAGIAGLIAIRRLEGIEEDRRAGVPLGRAIVSRVLFDLPGGERKA
jgi:glycerol-3-phosphate acyltransferase PlsY